MVVVVAFATDAETRNYALRPRGQIIGRDRRLNWEQYCDRVPNEPMHRFGKGRETPPSTRKTWVDKLAKAVKLGHDGPHEVEDAAEQESEYPADETDEG